MKPGDLVRVKKTDTDIRDRTSGIVVRFDTYEHASKDIDWLDGRPKQCPITEVLWPSGMSWIVSDRIEVISDASDPLTHAKLVALTFAGSCSTQAGDCNE